MSVQVSAAGVSFVGGWEGFRSCPYQIGDGVTTIGFGSTYRPDGKPVTMSTACITQKKARAWLHHFLNKDFLAKVPKRRLMKQQERDALASFAYNLGAGAVSDPSFSTLARRLKSHEGLTFKGRCRIYREEMPKWVSPGSQFEAGLRRRRQAEVRLATTGHYH